MKKAILLLLCSLFIINSSIGQSNKPSVKIFSERKTGLKEKMIGLVGQDDDGYYLLKIKELGTRMAIVPIGVKGKLTLEKYDKNYKLENEIPIKDIHLQTEFGVKKAYEFFSQDKDDNLYIFYSSEIENKTILYKSQLDKASLTFSNPEIVSELKNIDKKDRRGSYRLLTSKNGKKKAAVSIVEAESDEQTIINIDYLDENLNRISSLEEILNYKEKDVAIKTEPYDQQKMNKDISDIVLSNNGDVVLLARLDVNSSVFRTSYNYNIIALSENQTKPNFHKLYIPKKYIISVGLVALDDTSNFVQCYAFFTGNSKVNNNIEGTYSLIFDAEKFGSKKEKTNVLDEGELIDLMVGKESSDKNDRKILERLDEGKELRSKRFYLRDVNHFNDGSYTAMAEYFLVDIQTTNDGNGTRTTTYSYYCGDMVFLHYDANGNLEWIKNVDKYQFNSGTGGINNMGTFHFEKDNKIYFLYDDHTNKETRFSSIDKRGRLETKVIAKYGRKTRLGKYYTRTSTFHFSSPNVVFGYAYRGDKKMKGIRLEF